MKNYDANIAMYAVPLDAGPNSTGPPSSQPELYYIDRVPSGIADIDFEQQPTSQNGSRRPVRRGNAYAGASPPNSSNAGGAMMRSTGSKQGQGGPLGPSSLVGVIHDTMSSLVCSSRLWCSLDAPSAAGWMFMLFAVVTGHDGSCLSACT